MAMQARPKILYIVGAGRSGSTILDIALGNSPEICSSGELVHLPERGWLDDQCLRRKGESVRLLARREEPLDRAIFAGRNRSQVPEWQQILSDS